MAIIGLFTAHGSARTKLLILFLFP